MSQKKKSAGFLNLWEITNPDDGEYKCKMVVTDKLS